MTKLHLAAALAALLAFSCGKGPAGPAGPQGPAGPAGPGFTGGASISAVSPLDVAVGNTVTVSISGFATNWTNAATVSFGAGTKVTKTVAASATALVATVSVDEMAAPGTRDVTVTEGGSSVSFKGAFTIHHKVEATAEGSPAPGGVVLVRLDSYDPRYPLDNFPSLTFTPSPVYQLPGSLSSATEAEQVFGIDVFLTDGGTPSGALDAKLTLGSSTDPLDFPGLVTVKAPAFDSLSPGTPVSGTLAKPYDSTTYQADFLDGGGQWDVTLTGADAQLAVLPSSGRWTSNLFIGTGGGLNANLGGTFYFTVWNTGASSAQFGLSLTQVAPETEPNDTTGTANTLALPGSLAAELGTLTDVDYFKVTAAAGDVGKAFYVTTSAGDPYTDTVVDVLDGQGMSLGGPSSDSGLHEKFTSSPIPAAGDYFVKVYYSTYVSSYDPTASHYVVRVETK